MSPWLYHSPARCSFGHLRSVSSRTFFSLGRNLKLALMVLDFGRATGPVLPLAGPGSLQRLACSKARGEHDRGRHALSESLSCQQPESSRLPVAVRSCPSSYEFVVGTLASESAPPLAGTVPAATTSSSSGRKPKGGSLTSSSSTSLKCTQQAAEHSLLARTASSGEKEGGAGLLHGEPTSCRYLSTAHCYRRSQTRGHPSHDIRVVTPHSRCAI